MFEVGMKQIMSLRGSLALIYTCIVNAHLLLYLYSI